MMEWTAPVQDLGALWFYVAANAADGTGSSGDYIYTIVEMVPEPSSL